MKKLLLSLTLLLLLSCAGSYKPMSSSISNFPIVQEESGLKYSYKYGLLTESKNKKYAKKESKKGVQIIAVNIENNTGKSLNFNSDIAVYLGKNLVYPMNTELIYGTIKQPAPLYLLWGLLWVFISNCNGSDCNTIPLPVGFAIGIGNMAAANSANKKILLDLAQYNLMNKEIPDGESVSGIIGIPKAVPEPISFRLK
jgi:hypothetical protein